MTWPNSSLGLSENRMFSRHSRSIAGLAILVSGSIASFLLLWPCVSSAKDSTCSLNDDPSIAVIIQNLDRLATLLPPIPDQQNKALQALENQVLIAGLDAHDPAGAARAVNDQTNNPYYYLRRARIALKRARGAVSIVLIDPQSLNEDKYIGTGFPNRFYQNEYADTDAVKLDHAAYALGPVEAMELAVVEFLQRDERQIPPLVQPSDRTEIERISSGYTAMLGMYVQCKLSDVTAHHKANGASSRAQ